jgi:uncharacterized DUF497 family protein
MKISGILWLDDVIEKIESKHGVSWIEAGDVLKSARKFRYVEKGHRPLEHVYSAMGQTNSGRYLIVFFVLKKNGEAVVISARDMDSAERKLYAKK